MQSSNIQEWNQITSKLHNVIYSRWLNNFWVKHSKIYNQMRINKVYMFNVWTIIIQSLNIKEWKLLELQITQTRHHLSISDVKNVYNQNTKFEYKGMKTAWVTDYTNKTPPKHFGWKKMSKFNSPKNRKMFIKFAQKGEAHVQCMNNHYAKLEY